MLVVLFLISVILSVQLLALQSNSSRVVGNKMSGMLIKYFHKFQLDGSLKKIDKSEYKNRYGSKL